MKSMSFCAALVVGLVALSPRAHADNDWLGSDEVRPALRLGLGPQFATNPNSRMLTGQFLAGIDLRLERIFGLSFELGYSGERRGRLAGRHLVVGGAFRYGGILGLSALVHGMVGRTAADLVTPAGRSGGIRAGGRVDVAYVAGLDIQYEHRFIDGRSSESGFRMVFWFDALFALKALGST